jgi:flagellar basal-body rod protein FlgF
MNSGASVYVLASRMLGQAQRLDMVADNVANANTHGFKRLAQDMKETIGGTPLRPAGSFTENQPVRIIHQDGALETTGNTFDVALQGEGFFAIQDAAGGDRKYTRVGQFALDVQGNLVTMAGERVMDVNDAPITLPIDQKITIARDGTISTEEGIVANLGVYRFENIDALKRAGATLYMNDPNTNPALPVATPQVFQGMLEGSNVNPIIETVNMTTVLRSYQSTLRAMTTLEEAETTAIRDLARIPQ